MVREVKVFIHPKCGASRVLQSMLKKTSLRYEEVDVRGCGSDLNKYNIRATPTTVLVENGSIKKSYLGRDKDRILVSKIKEFLNDS